MATTKRAGFDVVAATTNAATLTAARPIRTRGDRMTRDTSDYAAPDMRIDDLDHPLTA